MYEQAGWYSRVWGIPGNGLRSQRANKNKLIAGRKNETLGQFYHSILVEEGYREKKGSWIGRPK